MTNKLIYPPSNHFGHELDKVIPGLFISGFTASCDLYTLRVNKITHILTIGPFEPTYADEFEYKLINIEDSDNVNILQHFEETHQFIDKVIKGSGCVLVHCMAGISRSATIVLAYLMRSRSMTVEEAVVHLKKARPVIRPNSGFLTQLKIYHNVDFIVDEKHADYRRFLITKMAAQKKTGNIDTMILAPDPETARQQATAVVILEASPQESAQTLIQCKKCRRKLVHSDNIVEHTPGNGQNAFSYFKRDDEVKITTSAKSDDPSPAVVLNPLLPQLPVRALGCSSYFIEPMEWIPDLEHGSVEGRIECPKCAAKLGSYNWAGTQCSCGRWVVPAFMLHRNKVDETAI